MQSVSDYVSVTMTRPNLRRIPYRPLPKGFSMRFYRAGDEEAWVRIWQAADLALGVPDAHRVTFETWRKAFGIDPEGAQRRCFFLIAPDGREVGTASAWYDYRYAGRHWGRLHWVAIDPEFQGKGLCKPMLSVVLARMWELGHRRSVLGTQTARLAAIKAYLDYGYVPDLSRKGAAEAWKPVQEKLRHPALERSLTGTDEQ